MLKLIHSIEQKRLCAFLIRKRKQAGLTQDQVARRLGVYQSFVSKYETGERCLDIIELIAIAEVLGIGASAVVAELEG